MLIPGYTSGHSAVILELELNPLEGGRGLWTFNYSLLREKDLS